MENVDWKLVVGGISMLSRALPEDKNVRRWVILGTLAVLGIAAAIVASQPKLELEPGPPPE